MGNRNSSNSKVRGQTPKVASTEPQYVPWQGKPSTKVDKVGFPSEQGHGTKGAAFRDEYIGKPKAQAPGPLRGHHGHGVHSEVQRKVSLDNDDTFTNFIHHAKRKIRSITMPKSNVDREQHTNTAAAPTPDEANGTTANNSKENQKDPFSDFIQLAKKKIRTTSSIRKNSSFKRG